MHLSIRRLEVKDYRQHKNKIYAISRDPGVGLMKAFSSSNAEKTTTKKPKKSIKLETSGCHQSQTGHEISRDQPSFTAANLLSSGLQDTQVDS